MFSLLKRSYGQGKTMPVNQIIPAFKSKYKPFLVQKGKKAWCPEEDLNLHAYTGTST